MRISKILERFIMRINSLPEGRMKIIRDIEFSRSLLNNQAYGRIMNTAYSWEKMMFNLKIQTSNVPGKQFIIPRKIIGGQHFMNCPMIFDHVLFIWDGMHGFFNNMRKLKNDAQN